MCRGVAEGRNRDGGLESTEATGQDQTRRHGGKRRRGCIRRRRAALRAAVGRPNGRMPVKRKYVISVEESGEDVLTRSPGRHGVSQRWRGAGARFFSCLRRVWGGATWTA